MNDTSNVTRHSGMFTAYLLKAVEERLDLLDGKIHERFMETMGGHIGLVSELADIGLQLALHVEASETAQRFNVEGWPGVFEYEVIEPFGEWLANVAIAGRYVFPDETAIASQFEMDFQTYAANA